MYYKMCCAEENMHSKLLSSGSTASVVNVVDKMCLFYFINLKYEYTINLLKYNFKL